MNRTFAIGDIHGCLDTFKILLTEKLSIQKSDEIYCVGDYIDRGNNSKGVIDYIINLRLQGYRVHTLRGNHEQMMLDSTNDRENFILWLRNGGDETLKSFGITSVEELPTKYLSFLKDTKLFIATNEFIFVHAGLNFKLDDPFKDEEAMLWTRDKYFDKTKIRNRILIHGHTPISLKAILKQRNANKINIDAGCVYDYIPGLGNLVALSLSDMQFLTLKNMET